MANTFQFQLIKPEAAVVSDDRAEDVMIPVLLGYFGVGMFHLVTHAFFKALLFLSAGSVILGLERGHHHLAHNGHHNDSHHEEEAV